MIHIPGWLAPIIFGGCHFSFEEGGPAGTTTDGLQGIGFFCRPSQFNNDLKPGQNNSAIPYHTSSQVALVPATAQHSRTDYLEKGSTILCSKKSF